MHLKEDSSVNVEVFADQDENFLGIFYQDHSMKQLYSASPEVLFVDATHKVNELRMPLYIFLCCSYFSSFRTKLCDRKDGYEL